jgi:phage replication O-like protein O
MSNEKKEAGIVIKKENISDFTYYPNILIDELTPYLSGGECKVLSAVVRQTEGYGRTQARIPISMFVKMTGLSVEWIDESIKRLEKLGVLIVVRQRKGNCYSLDYSEKTIERIIADIKKHRRRY